MKKKMLDREVHHCSNLTGDDAVDIKFKTGKEGICIPRVREVAFSLLKINNANDNVL